MKEVVSDGLLCLWSLGDGYLVVEVRSGQKKKERRN